MTCCRISKIGTALDSLELNKVTLGLISRCFALLEEGETEPRCLKYTEVSAPARNRAGQVSVSCSKTEPSLERLLRISSLNLELVVIVLAAAFASDPSFCYTSFELNSDRVSRAKGARREQMTPQYLIAR